MSSPDDPLENLLRTARARRSSLTGPPPDPVLDPRPAPDPPSAVEAGETAPVPVDPAPSRLFAAPAAAARLTQRSRAPAASAEHDGGTARGLSPLDLLALPPTQQRCTNWLVRRGLVPVEELKAALRAEIPEIDTVLAALVDTGYIHESRIAGVLYCRVVFGGTVRRGGRGVPDSLWSRLEVDNTTFLRQVPLFQRLTDEQLGEVGARLEPRHFHRNEIILWQGTTSDQVFFIKTGVVGISRISPQTRDSRIVAYLKEGDILGEYSALAEQGRAASATATALSEVDALVMAHSDFLALLERYNGVAIALARLLARRISATSERSASDQRDAQVCLVFHQNADDAGLITGAVLAMALARLTPSAVAYTRYPDAERLHEMFGLDPGGAVYNHPGGFQVVIPDDHGNLPAAARATLLLDRLTSQYRSVVIGMTGVINEAARYLIEQADQIVLLAPVGPAGAARPAQLEDLGAVVRAIIRPERTQLVVIAVRDEQAGEEAPLPAGSDFAIPAPGAVPTLAGQTLATLPPALVQPLVELARRLGHNNQIGIYIPTTLDVDQTADTSAWVEQTLAFLGTLFGGATSNQAQGVWNSDKAGLVSETIFIVRTYASQAELDRHLPNVLTYVERLKEELKQEAMALEVNQKLLII
jgi:CRP-like cAMP-binding protein